jgi:hypothetical protein
VPPLERSVYDFAPLTHLIRCTASIGYGFGNRSTPRYVYRVTLLVGPPRLRNPRKGADVGPPQCTLTSPSVANQATCPENQVITGPRKNLAWLYAGCQGRGCGGINFCKPRPLNINFPVYKGPHFTNGTLRAQENGLYCSFHSRLLMPRTRQVIDSASPVKTLTRWIRRGAFLVP